MATPVRLSRRLSELLSCSRREAELYIEGGWVLVDGKVVEQPQFKVSGQNVALHPDATLDPQPPVTLLLNKPVGYRSGEDSGDDASTGRAARELLTPAHRSAADDSGKRPLHKHFQRLLATLPLDADACGLLVFTQDRSVARKLTEDAARIEQEFVVEVSGRMEPGGLERLRHGLSFNGRPLAPIKVSWQNESRLRFAAKGVQPGQIPSMCQSVGLRAVDMKRIRIGAVPMARLAPGEWRYLPAGARF